MNKLIGELKNQDGEFGRYMFWCPGCKAHHWFDETWSFNGNFDNPTISPSILVNRHDARSRCHLFVKAGQIQFLADCHHELAGQTVDMEPERWSAQQGRENED